MEQVIIENEKEDLMVVQELKKHFPIKNGVFGKTTGEVKAVDGVSFTVKKGETFSIVGESGCGKSTVGMSLLRLTEPTSGKIIFNEENMLDKNRNELRDLRKNIQIIFQDTYSSLNPKHTIKKIISEPLVINRKMTNEEMETRVLELLDLVGLGPHHLYRYPHEFSGGQRQRIGIARALALNPQLIVCDEPVSALDVSIQSQILNLLEELQKKFNLTYIFISHDLSVVEHISDRVAVMYLGRIVEMGSREEVFQNPQHPYTKALMSSVPIADPKLKDKKQRIILTGDVPSPKNPPKGCHFHTRCPFKTEKCAEIYPEYKEIKGDHKAACHII
ncbi:ABC transporter ATP-binding protein [Bacillus dakarensis]|uniref:ABC transporter ATP-binding protein n=1 Tax=Robertmurraya dakarensis TaxID=1926278 RepID=UPI0023515D4C|nr:dipeptide ABC transporter ATP-binding protein [Bacillus dakarensis]